MSSTLTFFTNPMSRARIARWMLEEIGVSYETKVLSYGEEMKAAEYLAINPMGKVPTIKHGDIIVTETAAICAYLADAFPDRGLAPPVSSPMRAPYYRWMFFVAGPLEAAVTFKAFGVSVPFEKKRIAGFGDLADVTDTLEAAVSQSPYICGDKFTAADVYVGSHVAWGVEFGTLEARPAFKAYSARLSQRPAAIRAREIDDKLAADVATTKS